MPAVSELPASTPPSGADTTESSRPSAGLSVLLALPGLIGHPPCRTQRGDRGSAAAPVSAPARSSLRTGLLRYSSIPA